MNGTCVSSQDVAMAELGPLPEGKRHTKSFQSIQSGACSAPLGEQKRRWEPALCYAREMVTLTLDCVLPSAWRQVTYLSPSRLCQEHPPPALRTDGIWTHLPVFRCSSLGELGCASVLRAPSIGEDGLWQVFLWRLVLL